MIVKPEKIHKPGSLLLLRFFTRSVRLSFFYLRNIHVQSQLYKHYPTSSISFMSTDDKDTRPKSSDIILGPFSLQYSNFMLNFEHIGCVVRFGTICTN